MTTAWDTKPLTVKVSENGTLEQTGGDEGWKMLTPEGIPFQVWQNQDLCLAFHLTRLEHGSGWGLYLAGEIWDEPLTVSGFLVVDDDANIDAADINNGLKALLLQTETNF